MSRDRADILATARLAGQVLRYHTWPVHRQQSVGEHTWQVLRIYCQIFGSSLSPSPSVTSFILWHDAGELVTGDPPFPLKARNPSLKAIMDSLEEEAVENMGGNPRPAISDTERRRVKTCDLIDMLEFGYHELRMGNSYAYPIIDDITLAIRGLWSGAVVSDDSKSLEVYLDKVVGSWSWT